MGIPHLVQTGLMGVVGRFDSIDFHRYDRDTKVIVRTHRGLEAGKVLCEIDDLTPTEFESCGDLVRRTGAEDLMILERLERYRDQAFAACERLIAQRGLEGVLVDVEHIFDGQSVYFYFLGEISPELESLTHDLAAVYERKVRFRKFSETLANGCGPNCGSGDGGCSTGGCSNCSLANGCGKK